MRLLVRLKYSGQEIFLLFCQFKDIVDIKMGTFVSHQNDIKTSVFFDNLAVKVQEKLKNNLSTCVRFDQQEDGLPYLVRGDRHRIDYIF